MTDEQLTARFARIEADLAQLSQLGERVDSLETSMYGSARLQLPGVLTQLQKLTSSLDDLVKERQTQSTLIKGIAIGLGLTSVTGIGTLITVLTQVVGVAKP